MKIWNFPHSQIVLSLLLTDRRSFSSCHGKLQTISRTHEIEVKDRRNELLKLSWCFLAIHSTRMREKRTVFVWNRTENIVDIMKTWKKKGAKNERDSRFDHLRNEMLIWNWKSLNTSIRTVTEIDAYSGKWIFETEVCFHDISPHDDSRAIACYPLNADVKKYPLFKRYFCYSEGFANRFISWRIYCEGNNIINGK